jgi:hypothetical protein
LSRPSLPFVSSVRDGSAALQRHGGSSCSCRAIRHSQTAGPPPGTWTTMLLHRQADRQPALQVRPDPGKPNVTPTDQPLVDARSAPPTSSVSITSACPPGRFLLTGGRSAQLTRSRHVAKGVRSRSRPRRPRSECVEVHGLIHGPPVVIPATWEQAWEASRQLRGGRRDRILEDVPLWVRIPVNPYTQSGVSVHPGGSEAA